MSMPRLSEKAKDLTYFYRLRELLSDEWLDKCLIFKRNHILNGLDEEIKFLDDIIEYIQSSRYYSRSTKILKTPANREMFLNYDEKNFKQIVRMDLSTFLYILDKIKLNPIFYNSSNNPQRPVHEQLAISLEKLGSYGNSCSFLKLSRQWGVGEGTIGLYFRRVLTAIIDLKKEFVRWPNGEERIKINEELGSNFDFKGCVGLIDGTDIVFEKKPTIDGELYFSRKKILF